MVMLAGTGPEGCCATGRCLLGYRWRWRGGGAWFGSCWSWPSWGMVSFEITGRWSCCTCAASCESVCGCWVESCAVARGEEIKVRDAAATSIVKSREKREMAECIVWLNSIVFNNLIIFIPQIPEFQSGLYQLV